MVVSLLVFIIVYCSVFGVGYYYIIRLIKGAAARQRINVVNLRHAGAPLSAAEAVPEEEKS